MERGGGGYKRQHFRPISEMKHTVFPRMSARGAHLIVGLRGGGAHSREALTRRGAHLNIYPQRGGRIGVGLTRGVGSHSRKYGTVSSQSSPQGSLSFFI